MSESEEHEELLNISGQSWTSFSFSDTPSSETDVDSISNSDSSKTESESSKTYNFLSRQDPAIFGQFPKIQRKYLAQCDKCGVVLLPGRFPTHFTNASHQHTSAHGRSFSENTIPLKEEILSNESTTDISTATSTSTSTSSLDEKPVLIKIENTEAAPPIVPSIEAKPITSTSTSKFAHLEYIKTVIRESTTQSKISSPTQQFVITIPIKTCNIKMYESHPKPLIMPNRYIQKIGSTYVLRSQGIQLARQRNDIQTMLNKIQDQQPSLLKHSTRSEVKGLKRAASDKLINDNHKLIKNNDLNGFVLHTDVSKSSDASLHNNSVLIK